MKTNIILLLIIIYMIINSIYIQKMLKDIERLKYNEEILRKVINKKVR